MEFLPNAVLLPSLCAIRRRLAAGRSVLADGGRPLVLIAVLTAAFATLPWASCALAQDPPVVEEEPEDFLDMDLDELVETDTQVQVQMQATQEQVGVQEGILGGHVHKAGDIMFGYKYMYMEMDGNRLGTRRIADADVLQDFLVTPTQMTMSMHMVHAMYAPSDEWTFMAMVPFKRLSMDHLRRNGSTFNVTTEGIGDVSLAGFYTFYDNDRKAFAGRHPDPEKDCWMESWYEHHQMFAGLSLHLPTGTINATTPMGARAPYLMQLGSGTYDIEPSLTYSGISET